MEYKINIDDKLITEETHYFHKIEASLLDLYAKKNKDYGNSFESGMDEWGEVYALSRLTDKMNRLKNIYKNGSFVIESVEDTLADLACYSIMWLAYIDKNIDKLKK